MRKLFWILVALSFLLVAVHFVANPLGSMRLEAERERLEQGLKSLPPGSSLAAVKGFISSQGLEATDLTEEFWQPNDAPPKAKYQIRALLPFEYKYAFGSASLQVDFWLDKDKRLLTAEIGSRGSAL